MEEKYKSAFDKKAEKPVETFPKNMGDVNFLSKSRAQEVKPVVVKPEVKEVKKETVVEMLLRLLRGHGHIFNSYEIKLMEGEAPAKKIIDTYTDVKASRMLYTQAFEDKK